MTNASNQQTRARPESFRARELSASLTVKDLAKSLAWYTDIVGFTMGEKYERDGKVAGVQLKAGDIEVYVSQDDGKKGPNRVVGLGFSLGFTTVQDVDDLARNIKARGGTLESEPADMPWGARMFRLRDPDGFVLTISSDTP